jgi:hypothetical protein
MESFFGELFGGLQTFFDSLWATLLELLSGFFGGLGL